MLELGNRALQAVTSALQVKGARSLPNQVDEQPLVPTYDISKSLESSLGEVRWFRRSETIAGGGGLVSLQLDPRVAQDWTEIVFRSAERPGADGSPVAAGHDLAVTAVGISWTGTAAAFNDARLLLQTGVGGGVGRILAYDADSVITLVGPRVGTNSKGELLPLGLPLHFPGRPEDVAQLAFEADLADAGSLALNLQIISAPKGVLRRVI